MKSAITAVLAVLFSWPLVAPSQAVALHDTVRIAAGFTNSTITLSGRAELRVTGVGDPLPGCVIHLNSPDAWLLFSNVTPSSVAASLLTRVRVNGSVAALHSNVRVVQFAQGAVVIPHTPDFAPLEVFAHRHFAGPSKLLSQFTAYGDATLGARVGSIGSFKLKRGYMATFAQQESGAGPSRNYVAQDGDLEVSRLPASFETNVHYVRVFPWRWAGKKGIAGNIESGLNTDWGYNWNLDRNSSLDWEYVPIRQTRYWPGLGQDWKTRGSTHLLGYNEPDRPDQANLPVGDAINSWPDVLWPGLRAGAPAVSDGGLSWLYDFMDQADAAGLRVDFVPVHYYRCHGNAADPAGAASQFYNFLKGIYDRVQRPLWVTEWNNGANWTTCADPSFAQQQAAIGAMIDMLESTPFVERYALYNWVEDARRLKWDDGSLTAAGTTYRDKVSGLAYRQEMADIGVGSSAQFSFDGHAYDQGNNGFDAMLVGAPKYVGGRYGQAIELNGATDYLQASPRLGDSADFTFAGWVFWNGGGAWQRIFDLGDDTTHYLYLSPRTAGGSLRFAIQDGGGEQQLSGPPLAVGVWTHVAVTIAGSTGKLFVNGALVATNTAMSINPGDVGTKFNYLGRSRFAADPLFNGKFDDFRFMSSALTDAQVSAIYATPPPRFFAATIYKSDATAGQPYAVLITADASGTGLLTFSKMSGPAWLNVAANGMITGTPTAADGGVNTFRVRVTDANGSQNAALLVITVPDGTVTIAVGDDADDAEESIVTGEVVISSTDLELVNDVAGGAGDQIIGLRFNDIPLPRGAVVTNAIIQFTADESQANATSLNLFVEAADHAAPFTDATNNLGARVRLPLSVAWTPAAWTAGESNAAQRTPNVAGLVQELIARPGWRAGNSIAVLVTGTGHRTADAHDKSGGFPARLTLDYFVAAPARTAGATITAVANDAEQAASGTVTLNSTDLELVNDGALGDQTVGLRFENLALPPGSLVTSAELQFTADEVQTNAAALTVRAEAADFSTAFLAAANNLGERPVTAASVAWNPAPWATIGERGPLQRPPNLAALVREVIARPGWTNGGALSFLITGTGNRAADAADEVGGTPATLTVTHRPEPAPGTYDRWAGGFPDIGGPTDDFDEDGFDNVFEYALGLDPTEADAQAFQFVKAGNQLVLTYSRPSAIADITWRVDWSDRLGNVAWLTTGVTSQIISDNGIVRVIRATVPAGGSSQRFVRLRVGHQ